MHFPYLTNTCNSQKNISKQNYNRRTMGPDTRALIHGDYQMPTAVVQDISSHTKFTASVKLSKLSIFKIPYFVWIILRNQNRKLKFLHLLADNIKVAGISFSANLQNAPNHPSMNFDTSKIKYTVIVLPPPFIFLFFCRLYAPSLAR